MVYDKAKWHTDGQFPKDVPPENGGTHIGLFLAWIILHGLAGDELAMAADAVRERRMTGRTLLFNQLDGVLSDDDLNAEGNAFAAEYYKKYRVAFDHLMKSRHITAYHAADDWATYDLVEPMIDQAYEAFKRH